MLAALFVILAFSVGVCVGYFACLFEHDDAL